MSPPAVITTTILVQLAKSHNNKYIVYIFIIELKEVLYHTINSTLKTTILLLTQQS